MMYLNWHGMAGICIWESQNVCFFGFTFIGHEQIADNIEQADIIRPISDISGLSDAYDSWTGLTQSKIMETGR